MKWDLRRNTGKCRPRPIDLSRAGTCDFITVDEAEIEPGQEDWFDKFSSADSINGPVYEDVAASRAFACYGFSY